MGIRMSFQGAPWPNVLCTKGIHKGCNKKREMNRSDANFSSLLYIPGH